MGSIQLVQRYRKIKQIIERWPDNNIAPFEIDISGKHNYQLFQERAEAIRILFFKRLKDDKLNQLIGKSVEYEELKTIFSKHFENYRYYPALYNHFKIGDEQFSNLVIEKEFKLNSFKIFKNNFENHVIFHGLDFESAFNYYIQNELDWNFKGIEIIKEN